jgi:hypothetical protein
MNRTLILMLTGCLIINPAMADEVQQPSASSAETAQQTRPHQPLATHQWLELQRSGRSASAQPQPYSGEVMDKVHTRYLKSFEKPIPEFFEHEMRTAR